MKKMITVLFLVLVLVGCSAVNDTGTGDPSDERSEFYGTVLENHETSILVKPDADSWAINSADKISVNIMNTDLVNHIGEEITVDLLTTGARVRISFTGGIAESYPAQIHSCFEVRLEEAQAAEYKKISPEQAMDMMNKSEPFTLLDVRTDEEFKEKRIDGAILIPDYEIKDRVENELPDKSTIILIYCRSGRRSENAAREMLGLGYTNVYDFGGINDWPYETVSG